MRNDTEVAKITVHEVFDAANSCGDHPLSASESHLLGAKTLLALGNCNCTQPNETYATCGSYCDTESFAVARLVDGRYIFVEESSDSTGHGCRCSGSAEIVDTLGEILMRIPKEHHEKLILQQPTDAPNGEEGR